MNLKTSIFLIYHCHYLLNNSNRIYNKNKNKSIKNEKKFFCIKYKTQQPRPFKPIKKANFLFVFFIVKI